MSVSHNGKKPSKFWSFATTPQSVINAFSADAATRTDFIKGGKKLGIAIACPAAYMLTSTYAPMILAVPLVTPIAATACVIATAVFGFGAYSKLKKACNTYAVKNNIRDAEKKWLETQRQGGFIKSIQYKVGKAVSVVVAAAGIVVAGINAAQPETFAAPSPEQKTTLHEVMQSEITGTAIAGTGILGFAACAFADNRRRKALSTKPSASLRR